MGLIIIANLLTQTYQFPITLEVQPTGAIMDVKQQIEEKRGYRPDKRSLIFASEHLRNSCTAANYGIQDGVHLYVTLHLRSSMEISLRTRTGKYFPVLAEPSGTL
ncbi:hypothetical protein Gpo141_00002489 [Globisporangium polare]